MNVLHQFVVSSIDTNSALFIFSIISWIMVFICLMSMACFTPSSASMRGFVVRAMLTFVFGVGAITCIACAPGNYSLHVEATLDSSVSYEEIVQKYELVEKRGELYLFRQIKPLTKEEADIIKAQTEASE